MKHKEYYNESYFKWQGTIGEFGGWANLDKFLPYIDEQQTIVDFGSGGGYLLKRILNAKKRSALKLMKLQEKSQKKSVLKASSLQKHLKITLQI